MANFPAQAQLMHGHVSEETAYLIEDYPYGRKLRCKMKVWIETNPKHGDRECRRTQDPKNGRWNAIKKTTYYPVLIMYRNDQEHICTTSYRLEDGRDKPELNRNTMSFLVDAVGIANISNMQQTQLRVLYYSSIYGNYPYIAPKMQEETAATYKQWVIDTIKYCKTCDFAKLLDHPDKPQEDKPDGEVFKVTSYYIS